MKDIIKYAALDALGTAVYIMLVASFMYFMGSVSSGDGKTLLIPIAMLMLFVFSAAFTSILVLGRPIIWYLNGKKQEALSLLFYTLGILLVMTIIIFLLIISIKL